MGRLSNRHGYFGWCFSLVLLSSIVSLVGKGLGQQLNSTQAVGNQKEQMPGLIASHPDASRAWQDFSRRNNYRLARVDDFVLSTDRFRVYGDGDFNGDQIFNDFAIIVVDNSRAEASRFALVIFNARKNSKGYDGPFWLYRDVDLSSASLNLISHGPLIISENRGENATKVCLVRWNGARKTYECEAAP